MNSIEKFIKPISMVLAVVMFLNLTPLSVFAQAPASSPAASTTPLTNEAAITGYENSYDAFITEIDLTMKELAVINRRLGGEIESSEDVKKRLLILKTLNGKTVLLQKDLKTINNVTTSLSAIPQVRTPMKHLSKNSKRAMKKLKDLEKKIKPFHKKVTTFKQRVLLKGLTYRYTLVKQLKKLQKILNQELLDKAKQMDNYIQASIYCVNVDISADLEEATQYLDKITAALAVVRETLHKINNASVDVKDILDQINLNLRPFMSLKADLRVLDKILRKLRKALRAIRKALSKRIKYKFKYKIPVIGKRIKFKISFKINDIFKGPAKLFRWIEKKLGRFLWKIAKAIGLKKIIKRFINAAKRAIRKLLRKYNLDLDPNIGNIGKLSGIMAKLEKLFDRLGDIYLFPKIKLDFKYDFDKYFDFMPTFKKIAIACKKMKKADLTVNMIELKGEAVQDSEVMVAVEISDIQDMDAYNVLKGIQGFDASKYDRKCKLTIESDDGYKFQTEEFIVKAGQTRTEELPFTPSVSGAVQVSATVSIIEINDIELENNKKEISVEVKPRPVNLALASIEMEEEIVEGSQSLLALKVVNLDEVNSASAVIELKIDDGFVFKSEELLLAANGEEIIEADWTPAKNGKLSVSAQVSSSKNAVDINESDNLLTKIAIAQHQPIDLLVAEIQTAKKIYVGQQTEIKVKVSNEGPKSSGKNTVLKIETSDEQNKEFNFELKSEKSKIFTYKWTPESEGDMQIDATVESTVEDVDFEDNSMIEIVEVLSKKPSESKLKDIESKLDELSLGDLTLEDIEELEEFLNDPDLENILDDDAIMSATDLMDKGMDELTKLELELPEMPQNIEEVRAQIEAIIEKLKTDYAMGNKAKVLKLFSNQFPGYAQLIHSFQEDFQFLRNINMNYRIDAINVASDLKSAIAKVYWEIKFMLHSGKFFSRSANMSMRFKQEKEDWKIDGLTGNKIFGLSKFSMADLMLMLSNLTVTPTGTGITISGVVVKNAGQEAAPSFRARFTYKKATGQTYTAYTTVSSLAAGSQRTISTTISSVFTPSGFPPVSGVPGLGDTLTIELDVDGTVLEIKTNNNLKTESFPF